MNDHDIVKKVAELSNMNLKFMFMLISFLALSIGLAFFFLVPGAVGKGVGITMFVVCGLLFVLGEVNYYIKKKRITDMQQ